MEHVDFRLDGKVAVITGAAQGLGRSMAEALSSCGADIVVADIQDEKAKATAAELSSYYGNKVLAVHLDVSNKSSIDRGAAEVLASFGKVDILVNNAGIVQRKKIEELEEKEWDLLMNINLKGVFLCSQAFGKSMIENRKGRIINMSSVVGFLGAEERLSYATSKSGVAHMTRLIASEWAKYGITANAIAPGYLLTELTTAVFGDHEVGRKFLEYVPAKYFGKPSVLSGLVVFLASDLSHYITGQVIFVDGGRMLV